VLHWAWGRKPTVALLGDSNVARLRRRHPILNLGVSHNTSKDFLDRIRLFLISSESSAISDVVIWGPTNDIHYWNGFGVQYIREAGSIAQGKGHRVTLCTVCPHIDQSQPARGRTHEQVHAGLIALNSEISDLARDKDWGLADCYTPLITPNGGLIKAMFLPEDSDPPTLLHLSRLGQETCVEVILRSCRRGT
jgi:hypothetical protein